MNDLEYGPRSTDPGYYDLTPVQQAFYDGYDMGWYARGGLLGRIQDWIAGKARVIARL